ncbi:transposase [Desulfobacterota bacterium AH_259_B03_O07]|nr:transposase [Desulfobacterota bacterium AH_259_B03_O07]
MARPLRLSFDNACYHITSRGNRKENIFYTDNDRLVFLERLNETLTKYSFVCYAYCLMDNHYHLFVKTPNAIISEGMHYLNTSYTNWFKAEHSIVGVIFQGRYKSILVDEDSYGLVLSAYIHLNPLRSGIVEDLSDYKWSSYLDYEGKRKSIKRVDTEFVLKQFGEDIGSARRRYRAYVLKHKEIESPLKESYRGIALGAERYIEKIKEKISSMGRQREIKETRLEDTYSEEEIMDLMEEKLTIERGEIIRKRKGNVYRQLALYLIKSRTRLSLKEIGEVFKMDYAAVSQAVKRFRKLMEKDGTARKMKDEIERELG